MQETEMLRPRPELTPMRERRLEKNISADDIGVDEFRRAIDRSVDVALGGEMHHGVGMEARENIGDSGAIADIGAAEPVAGVFVYHCQRGGIAGIGQLVNYQYLVVGVANESADKR